MSRRRKLTITAIMLVLGAVIFLAAQSRTVQNLYYALGYERTLDRYSQADTTQTDITNRRDAAGRDAELISAFFGLDDGLPRLADRVICDGAGGQDGMPVIFSHQVDIDTLDPGDFRIVTASGAVGETLCLTLAPADDPGELRTVLLAGQFGDAEDQPVRVEIAGNILSLDGEVNFNGAQVAVTPIEDGPSLVLAEILSEDQWAIGARATGIPFGGGSGCPEGTRQVVRATWGGGVTKPDGSPADDAERSLYQVEVERPDGSRAIIVPAALADLGDGDNNHKLCLDTPDRAVSVSFPANRLTDPRDDLNPMTSVAVSPAD